MPVFHDPLLPQPGSRGRRAPVAPSAVQPVPLKAPLADHAPASVRKYEAYNPYPPRVRSSSWPEIALVAFLAFAGLAFVSTFFLQKFAEKQVRTALIKAVAPLSETATFSFGRVSVGLFRGSVQVRDVDVTLASSGESVHVDRVAVWGVDASSLKQMLLTRKPVLPRSVKMAADGVSFNTLLLGERGQALMTEMGYESLRLSLNASVHFDRSAKTFSLENFRVAVPQVGQFDLSFALGNVMLPTGAELTRMKKDPRKLLEADFSRATIKAFDVTFVDGSLVNRVLETLRKLPGETSPITLVELALAMNGGGGTLGSGAASASGSAWGAGAAAVSASAANVDFVKPALEKLHAFLMYPRSISLSAHPPREVPLMTLLDDQSSGSINDLAHRLNMRVE